MKIYKTISVNVDDKSYEIIIKIKLNIKKIILKYNLKKQQFEISAPYGLKDSYLIDFFLTNKEWALSQIPRHIDFSNPNHIKYQNNIIPISYEESDANKYIFIKEGPLLRIFHTKNDNIPLLITKFLKEQAYNIFYEMSLQKANIINVSFNKVSISDTYYRWGSCSSTKNLRYNYRIIMAPLFVIDYLVAHEVAHLREFNHSKNFWSLVNQLTPFCQEAKIWLKENGKSLY